MKLGEIKKAAALAQFGERLSELRKAPKAYLSDTPHTPFHAKIPDSVRQDILDTSLSIVEDHLRELGVTR